MQLSLSELLVAVLIPVLPLLTLATAQYVEQVDALSKLESLKTHCEKAWANSLTTNGAGNISDARAIQDEIYEMRKRSPFVFDFIFKRIRSSNEYLMNVGVADFVKQAREKGLA
ncbi:MAG: hypothetical protein EOP05_23445 [Proteobacteria bacterium]|nr:MAG: hypothetical protein EOP05_23445 [Pseudomonadota bacterium]